MEATRLHARLDSPPLAARPAAEAAVAARVVPPAPRREGDEPWVFAIVPAFNRCDLTLRFCRKFAGVTYRNKRVVIVDDNSSDNTLFHLELNFPDVIVVRGDGNLWWSGGTNAGVRYALEHGADYILTINDDCVMDPEFLTHMVDIARRDPKYIVGCRIHSETEPDRIWALGTTSVFRGGEMFRLNYAGQRWDDVRGTIADPYPTDCMPGNGVLIPRAVFEQVGLYDAVHMPQYHADSDLVLRARKAGFQPVVSLRSVLHNHILDRPLVNNRLDLIFSRKSDRYWRALRTTFKRHAPWGRRTYLLMRQYSPFFFNGRIAKRIKRLVRRLLEGDSAES
ncbi:MAG: glycosyltransferase family 2 protein [Phycisphaerae bacterium]